MKPVESFDDEHEAFAASRVTQYVYVPTKDSFFSALDQHADTLEGDVKPPLVLLGNEGSGKSALLANWASKKREHRHRDEFLFQHFVGCTTPSLQLMHTLFRLETALKDFFQLREMKVPDSEVELRWSLNRFLEAAAKKHSPARIIIIIDGINRLKAEGAPDGALHWLPTELPPCVRFIVSTVEFERSFRGKKEGTPHRAFIELVRRQCPILRIEPLDVNTRHSVIHAFLHLHKDSFELTDGQQFKIVTANSSAQPMYLRSLLQALRLASNITATHVDVLLEKFLACTTAHELIDKNLNFCCQKSLLDEGIDAVVEDTVLTELLGKMFSVVFVSRTGLSEKEIWGLMRLVSSVEASPAQAEVLMTILKDFTMVVDELHSFSHEIYREVIYHKYISSKASLLRWHNIMAKFFNELGPCDRKLVALPYHLEMAGSWAKVKNCLTDIDMFQLWWTPKFKSDFIKFWTSLTRVTNQNEQDFGNSASNSVNKREMKAMTSVDGGKRKSEHSLAKVKTTEHSDADGGHHGHRPTYDIVEEYVKSLDEFRNKKKPSDETVSSIILEIADFLLEFATLGYEQHADVPNLVHPPVLSEDLKTIGVPYIEYGRDSDTGEIISCSLVYPEVLYSLANKQKADDGAGLGGIDAPGKAGDDVPLCTAYYFFRWMWIQYPYIALGNCDSRYITGINQKNQDNMDGPGRPRKLADGDNADENLRESHSASALLGRLKTGQSSVGKSGMARTTSPGGSVAFVKNGNGERNELSKSFSTETHKLPEIKFNRKAARSFPRVKHEEGDPANAVNNKVMEKMILLQENIQNCREEYDFVVQMKAIVAKRLQDLKDQHIDLIRTADSCSQFDGELSIAMKRESEVVVKYEKEKAINANLVNLFTIISRHPANVPALILELQTKIAQDEFLIHEIKKRLWEQKFEHQTYTLTFRHMKKLVQDAVSMHTQLLEFGAKKYSQSKKQAMEDDQNNMSSFMKNKKSISPSNKNSLKNGQEKSSMEMEKEPVIPNENRTWDEVWSLISSRTGMIEPEAFFQRIQNSTALLEQINTIKRTSEGRLESLRKEVVEVESELEESRYEASFAGAGGGQSSKENKKELGEKLHKLKEIKEKTESMEQLEQKVVAGLAHISDILFIPKSEEDATPSTLVRDIEAVLDTLINEREKQLQQHQQQGQQAIETSHQSGNRSPELDFVIAKHEDPKVRLPRRLPSRPSGPQQGTTTSRDDEDEHEEEGMWDRSYVKTTSQSKLRSELKRAVKGAKTDAKRELLATI